MSEKKLPKAVVIVGPTASGKTALSLALARSFNSEIISADSQQVYKGMDIGTAKPPKNEMGTVKHHLISILNPDREYSAGRFKKDAVAAINKIINSGKLPIIVGGTGLYISALVDNLEMPKVKENKTLRRQLEKEIEKNGLKSVYNKLIELDPEAANIVDPNNSRRIIRALEITLGTGWPFSGQRKKGKPLFDFLQIGINQPPEILKFRIAKRTQKMFANGLIQEAQGLLKKYSGKQRAFDAIGYREVILYLRGEISLDQAKELIIKNTWQYAKRQMTWFSKDKSIKWISDFREAESLVLNFLDKKAA